MYANCLSIRRLVIKLDQAARVRWFLHRASHHGPEHLAFESLMSLEAKAAIKHRQNDLAREYIKILDNNDIQGKERTKASVRHAMQSHQHNCFNAPFLLWTLCTCVSGRHSRNFVRHQFLPDVSLLDLVCC